MARTGKEVNREELKSYWDYALFTGRFLPGSPFEQVQNVMEGLRTYLDRYESHDILKTLLESIGGCDLVVTPVNFEGLSAKAIDAVQYEFMAAPFVVSELLRLAEIEIPVTEVRALIGPGVLGPGIGFGRKLFWLDTEAERVVIHLRTATGDDERDLAERPEPYPGLLVPALCPFCAQVLRTPRAKQCRFCKRDWHDAENLKWLDGRPVD